MARALWLADVLRAAGLKVVEVDGWETRGAATLKATTSLLFHHTATSATAKGNLPTLNLLVRGRSDLPGPLCQLAVGRDGTWYTIASGKANHAGRGAWRGTDESSETLGVEVEHPGGKTGWTDAQYRSVVKGFAAILRHLKLSEQAACGHKEWALPAGRKVDPNVDMNKFRLEVAEYLKPAATVHCGVPEHDHRAPVLRHGSKDSAVNDLQGHLNAAFAHYPEIAPLKIDGHFGERTLVRLREWERRTGITIDGVVDAPTWKRLHEVTNGRRIDENGKVF